MKAFILLACFALTSTAVAVAVQDRVHGENGWYVPDISNIFKWLDASNLDKELEKVESKIEGLFANDSNPVKFYILTNENPSDFQEIFMTYDSIKNSYYNASNPTKFSIHGWTMSYTSAMNTDIAQAWFKHGLYNIIVPDWSRARSVDYIASVAAVPGVGKKVANLIDFINENFGLDFNTLELIGHSLGAHVSGFTGKNVKNGKINTIIGLDAALPLYHINEPSQRLCSTDANYVQTIHTCGGKLGFLKPIGASSFYPNGGSNQPGCGIDITGACDHGRSVTYYVEAVQSDNFASIKCSDYEDANAKECGSTYSSARMGDILTQYKVSGIYYVPVNSKAPYGTLTA